MNRLLYDLLGKVAFQRANNATSDQSLLSRFVTDADQSAFELLMWRHGGYVLRICQSILRHTQDSEDAFQAIFLILARKASDIRSSCSLPSWLFKTAHRVCFRARKKLGKDAFTSLSAHASLSFSEKEEELRFDEVLAIQQEVRKLASRYQTVVTLFYFCGYSTKQIAKQLQIPRGTVLSRLAAAKKTLKNTFSRRGLSMAGLAGVFALRSAAPAVSADVITTTAMASTVLLKQGSPHALAGMVSGRTISLLEDAMRYSFTGKARGFFAVAVLLLVGAGIGLWSQQPGKKPPFTLPNPLAGNQQQVTEPAPNSGNILQAGAVLDAGRDINLKPAVEGVVQITAPQGTFERQMEIMIPVPVTVNLAMQFKGKQMSTTLTIKMNEKGLAAFEAMEPNITKELGFLKDAEIKIKLDGEYSLSADGLLYGVITFVEVNTDSINKIMTNPLVMKQITSMGAEFAQISMFAPGIEMAGGLLMDQPFSLRFRRDGETLSIKDVKMCGLDLASKVMGPMGMAYSAVTNGRFKRKAEGTN